MCLLRGTKGSELQVDHSPPSNAEVKNEQSYISPHPICLHGVDREDFTFYIRDIDLEGAGY